MFAVRHTAAAHVATVEALLDELDATVARPPAVAVALLDQARAAGMLTPEIVACGAAPGG